MSALHPALDKQLRLWAISADYATAHPEHRAKNADMPARAASVLASVRLTGASLTPDQMAMVGTLSAFTGQPVAVPTPARVPAAAKPAPAHVALSADNAQAILAEGRRLRLDAMAVKMVALGVALADARDLLATAAGGAGGTVPAVPKPASGVQRAAPAPAGAGGASASAVNREAVAAARAYAAARRSRVA
jgi:hypothetical protein